MTHILVTNDDGITSAGLLALAQALRPLGAISVLAPDHNWSASGHVKTLHKPLRVKPVHLADGTPALASTAHPSDCVALAMLGIIPEKIDLLVSGINAGINVGHDLTYSGTVTAAMEAVISGVPAVAVSLDLPEDQTEPCDYTPAAHMAERVARQVLVHGLPKDTLLNLNVPCLAYEKIRGVLITRQGLRVYRDELRATPRPARQALLLDRWAAAHRHLGGGLRLLGPLAGLRFGDPGAPGSHRARIHGCPRVVEMGGVTC